VKAARGFTLIEVLVALVLMAIMSGMAWRGLDAMLTSRDVTQASIDRSTLLQTALAQWETDLDQLQGSGGVTPALAFDGASLRFTRRHPQGLQVVVWMVRDGTWARWASSPVTQQQALRQAWERSAQPLTLDAQRLSIMKGVTGWQVAYFWDNAWANALSSPGEALPPKSLAETPVQAPQAAASAASEPVGLQRNDPIPDAIRIQLEFGPGSGLSGTLTRQIALGKGA
jgi:general secretion pathway protein J